MFTKEKLLSYLYDKNVSVKLPITRSEIIENIFHLWTNETSNSGGRDSSKKNSDDTDPIPCDQANQNEILSEEHQLSIEKSSSENSSLKIEKSDRNDLNIQTTVELLAEQFSDWFYKLLNKNELAAEHFFPDGVLNLTLVLNGDTNIHNVCNDPIAITDTIQNLKNQYNLLFNPNLMKDSLKSHMDCHGLVVVFVGGTLHENSVCVGVFEQMFALARDPLAENNWKIKKTDIRLTNVTNRATPSSLSYRENENSDVNYIEH